MAVLGHDLPLAARTIRPSELRLPRTLPSLTECKAVGRRAPTVPVSLPLLLTYGTLRYTLRP